MIEERAERRALPREMINLPALLSFDGIDEARHCVARDINVLGARLSTPFYIFASNLTLSFSNFRRPISCRVVWRHANLSGVVFVLPDGMR